MICRLLFIVLIFLSACKEDKLKGSDFEKQVLEQTGLLADTTMNEMVTSSFNGINCLSLTASNRKMVLSPSFDPDDTTLILVIPFTSGFTEYGSSAYSDIKNRFILLNPSYISYFAKRNTLNDSTNMVGLISIMLLHELGHFITGTNGSFDAIVIDSSTEKQGGQMKIDTEPEYLTSVKRMEMKVDSIAIALVKSSITSKKMDCYGTASDIQLLLPGMSFQMFGMTMLEQFGKQKKFYEILAAAIQIWNCGLPS